MKCISEINELAQTYSSEQVFRNEPTNSISKDTIIKMRVTNKQITPQETEICKVLGKYKMATAEQLHKIFSEKISLQDYQKLLDKMVSLHLINKFVLVKDGDIPKRYPYGGEGLEIYSFDMGTKYLLENYDPNLDTSNWKLSDISGSVEYIYQKLKIVDFMIQLKKANISYNFVPQPLFKTKRFLKPSFSITTQKYDGFHYFIGYMAPAGPLDYQHIQNFILFSQEFINTNYWKGYFLPSQTIDKPKLLFILNTPDEVTQIIQLIYNSLSDEEKERFDVKRYVFTTYERLDNFGIGHAKCFYVFNDVGNEFAVGSVKEFTSN